MIYVYNETLELRLSNISGLKLSFSTWIEFGEICIYIYIYKPNNPFIYILFLIHYPNKIIIFRLAYQNE